MLSDGTRRALAAVLYDAGFTGVARLIAEGTTDVFELDATLVDSEGDRMLRAAAYEARRTRRAQLVLVTPDGEGEWLKPELVETIISGTFAVPLVPRDGTTAVPLTEEELIRAMDAVAVPPKYIADGPPSGEVLGKVTDVDGDIVRVHLGGTPDVLDIMRKTLERGR